MLVILWRILCSTLALLTSMEAVPVIPLIILYLQSVILTCAVRTHCFLPFAGVYAIWLLSYHGQLHTLLYRTLLAQCWHSFLLPDSRIDRECLLCLDGHLSSVPLP